MNTPNGSPTTRPRAISAWDEFLRGLTQPSLPAFAGSLAAALLCLALCICGVTPRFVGSRAAGYLMSNPKDDYGHLSAQVLRLMEAPPADTSFIAIGDSIMREAISSEEDLGRSISSMVGKRVEVHLFVASAMTHWEAAAVADCLRGRVRGVVALEVSPFNLSMGRQLLSTSAYCRLAISSEAFDEEIRQAGVRLPHRWNNYFLDHFAFFAVREDAIFSLIRGPVEADLHPADNLRAWNDEHWQKKWRSVAGWVNVYEKAHAANLAVYERMIERLRYGGEINVALLEGVQNPKLEVRAGDSTQATRIRNKYHLDLEAFAREHDVPYWDLREESNLREEDFVDYAHVTNPAARRRYTQNVARRVAELMQRHAG